MENPDEIFRLRISLELLSVFSKPVQFKPLIQRLSFIHNKKHWTGSIRGKAMVQIPEDDYDLIVADANKE